MTVAACYEAITGSPTKQLKLENWFRLQLSVYGPFIFLPFVEYLAVVKSLLYIYIYIMAPVNLAGIGGCFNVPLYMFNNPLKLLNLFHCFSLDF